MGRHVPRAQIEDHVRDRKLYAELLRAPCFENGNRLARVFTLQRWRKAGQDLEKEWYAVDVQCAAGDIAQLWKRGWIEGSGPQERHYELMQRIDYIEQHVPDYDSPDGLQMELWQVRLTKKPNEN